MPISDPQALAFTNLARVLSKEMRALDIHMDDAKALWLGGAKDFFVGFENEQVGELTLGDGRTPLTGQDVINKVTEFQAFVTQMNQAGIRDKVRKGIVGSYSGG